MRLSWRFDRDQEGRIIRSDAGSTLILVLVFVSFFSILIAGLLTMVDTSFREVIAVRAQRHATYAAESGIEAAIQYIRSNASQGIEGGSCDDVTVTAVNGQTVVVRCIPGDDSGLVSVGDDDTNRPHHALLTVDTDADTPSSGLEFIGPGGQQEILLNIDGPLFSNSQVKLTGGAALSVTNGTLAARAGCTGGTISPACGANTTTVVDDPQYPPASTIFPPLPNPPPVCAGGVATFTPGRYTDDPEDIIAATLGCTSITTEVFPAGVSPTVAAYYFEVPGSGAAARWRTSRIIKIGLDAATDACTVGAQLIFGGGTFLDLQQNSLLRVCAYKPPTGQRIGIYGAGSVARLRPITVSTSGTGGLPFTPASTVALNNLDLQHATATVTANTHRQSIRMVGFNQGWNGSSFSSEGNISSAKLRLRHLESVTNANQMYVSATVAPSDGSTPFTWISSGGACGSIPNCVNTQLTLDTAMHENSYELMQPTPGWTSASKFNGATVSYTVVSKTANNKTGRLDGAWIDVVYAPPGLKAVTGTVLSGHDFLINTPNTEDFEIKVTGTLYAPASQINLNLGLACDQALSRGAIVWRLSASLTGNCTPVSSPISLPVGSIGTVTDRIVLLDAFVGCAPSAPGCASKIRARIRFPSGGGAPIVERWTVIKT